MSRRILGGFVQEGSVFIDRKQAGGDCEYLVKWAFDNESKGVPEKIVDSSLLGKIAPACWEVFIEIVQRCLASVEERPWMGEVEVVLEIFALLLQERVDAVKLISTINLKPRRSSKTE
ncbi:hypothetical protein JHK82_052349 [Glycine max]|nr:hypothetical protein JHK85_053036 [Glycine max]KAG5082186.1 hypothetical protein JHK84_052224 [Glycine max]KAG5084952.1 hypothetical protein JHK82_052349 [Glycine max]